HRRGSLWTQVDAGHGCRTPALATPTASHRCGVDGQRPGMGQDGAALVGELIEGIASRLAVLGEALEPYPLALASDRIVELRHCILSAPAERNLAGLVAFASAFSRCHRQSSSAVTRNPRLPILKARSCPSLMSR